MRYLTGSSALRLCVWLFDDRYVFLSYRNKRLLLAFRAKQRKIKQDSIVPYFCMCLVSASRTQDTFFQFHGLTLLILSLLVGIPFITFSHFPFRKTSYSSKAQGNPFAVAMSMLSIS